MRTAVIAAGIGGGGKGRDGGPLEARGGRDGDGTRSEGEGEAVRRRRIAGVLQYHPRWPAACRGYGLMLRDWARSRFELSAAGGVWRHLQKRTIIISSCTAAPHARSPHSPAGYTRCAWIKKVRSDSRACGRGLRSVSALARRAGRGALRPARGRGRARACRGWRDSAGESELWMEMGKKECS
jgi:hypothetical protein